MCRGGSPLSLWRRPPPPRPVPKARASPPLPCPAPRPCPQIPVFRTASPVLTCPFSQSPPHPPAPVFLSVLRSRLGRECVGGGGGGWLRCRGAVGWGRPTSRLPFAEDGLSLWGGNRLLNRRRLALNRRRLALNRRRVPLNRRRVPLNRRRSSAGRRSAEVRGQRRPALSFVVCRPPALCSVESPEAAPAASPAAETVVADEGSADVAGVLASTLGPAVAEAGLQGPPFSARGFPCPCPIPLSAPPPRPRTPMHWKRGGVPPPPPRGRPAHAQPLSPSRQVPASMAFVTDSNRPQPLRQPPPTACLTASGAASGAASEVPLPAAPPRLSSASSVPLSPAVSLHS